MREIKFRALLEKDDERPGFALRWWEYYSTLHSPTWLDFQDVQITVKDLQFTGLLDSTKWEDLTETERSAWTRKGNLPSEWMGKEIYEGDVVRSTFPRPLVGVISYAAPEWRVKVGGEGLWGILSGKSLTVIGNIYEHPELLKSA